MATDRHHGSLDVEHPELLRLQMAAHNAGMAKELAEDGSKVESVADNTLRWAQKSVKVAERELEGDE